MFGHLFLLLASLASIVAGKDAEAKFEFESIYNRLGNLSPYHKAPVPSGVQQDLPVDCTVDQVMLVSHNFYLIVDCFAVKTKSLLLFLIIFMSS